MLLRKTQGRNELTFSLVHMQKHAQVGLDQLDIPALVRVLTEPKNAIVAQYHALFEMVCTANFIWIARFGFGLLPANS